MLSWRMNRIAESATMKIAAETIRLKSEGFDIVNLGIGEPDFDTPDFVREAAKKAIDENKTRYTLTNGIIELRNAISNRINTDFNLNYTADEIIVSNGAKQAIFNAVLALIDPGDQVIIPTPCWPTYMEVVHIAGGEAVTLDTNIESNFKITPHMLKSAITDKTKAILFSNPSNPTGMVYSKEELERLAEILKGKNIFVLSDEIYAKLIYDDYNFVSFGVFREYLDDKVVIFQGASKAYAMTGWRIGFAAGTNELIKACNDIQGHSTSNAATISQYAALSAFKGSQDVIEEMRIKFAERRSYVFDVLKSIKGIVMAEPHGAFYVFPQIDAFYGKAPSGEIIQNSEDITLYLLKKAHAAVVPGKGFESEDHIRISYATSMSELEKGLGNIKKMLEVLNV